MVFGGSTIDSQESPADLVEIGTFTEFSELFWIVISQCSLTTISSLNIMIIKRNFSKK